MIRLYMQPARYRKDHTEAFFVNVPNESMRRRIRNSYRDYREGGDDPRAARLTAAGLWLINWDGETLPPPMG